MSENKPTSPDRKYTFIAPLTIGILVLLIVATQLIRADRNDDPVAIEPVTITPAVRLSDGVEARELPPLTRGDLIREAFAAADRFSAHTVEKAGDPILGRNFLVKIAFGCSAPRLEEGTEQATTLYDPVNRTLRVLARRVDWSKVPELQTVIEKFAIEKIEGFWIPKPWTSIADCQSEKLQIDPSATRVIEAQTLGLAELFDKDASRIGQRNDRPYEIVRKTTDLSLLSNSYRLVLSGRITGFPSGQATHCWSVSQDRRPICLFGVQFDRVAIEEVQTGDILMTWER